MKVRQNITFDKLIRLLKYSTIVRSNIDRLPVVHRFRHWLKLYSWPVGIADMPFEVFIKAVKYSSNENTSLLFLSAISGYDANKISSMPGCYIYPLWHSYAAEVHKWLKMFEDVNNDLPAAKKIVKTMEEFGLMNIVFFIADNMDDNDKILKKSLSWVYINYRHKAHKLINQIAQQTNDTNS